MGLRFGLRLPRLFFVVVSVLSSCPPYHTPTQPKYPHESHLCPIIPASLLVYLNLLPLPSCARLSCVKEPGVPLLPC